MKSPYRLVACLSGRQRRLAPAAYGYTMGYTNGGPAMFSTIHHRRPVNVGVIAGDLWMAHGRGVADGVEVL